MAGFSSKSIFTRMCAYLRLCTRACLCACLSLCVCAYITSVRVTITLCYDHFLSFLKYDQEGRELSIETNFSRKKKVTSFSFFPNNRMRITRMNHGLFTNKVISKIYI